MQDQARPNQQFDPQDPPQNGSSRHHLGNLISKWESKKPLGQLITENFENKFIFILLLANLVGTPLLRVCFLSHLIIYLVNHKGFYARLKFQCLQNRSSKLTRKHKEEVSEATEVGPDQKNGEDRLKEQIKNNRNMKENFEFSKFSDKRIASWATTIISVYIVWVLSALISDRLFFMYSKTSINGLLDY